MLQPIVHVLGARPNFVKAAPVISALRDAEQTVIHTGQHYDERMSEIFFRELGLPEPDVNLEVGSGSHAAQTAAIMIGLEPEFTKRSPGLVIVYGDVNSTIAAALVAAKMGIPVAHVEAGLRSFDMTMPEEVNRRLTDQLSDLCFVTSPEAIGHLADEGVSVDRVYFVGNPMIDTLMKNLDTFDTARVRAAYELPDRYVLATLHRPANVDSPRVGAELVRRLHEIADLTDLIIPLHPRGRSVLMAAGLDDHPRLRVLDPLGYIDFIAAVRGAAAVVTDSGGIQEETTILGVPCLTVRPNTERPITITHGTNRLVTLGELVPAARKALANGANGANGAGGIGSAGGAVGVGLGGGAAARRIPPLWDGQAGPRIAEVVMRYLSG